MGKLLNAALVTTVMLVSINGVFAKDTLVVGEVLEPPGLDPTANAAAGIRQVTYANLYEGLVRITEDGTVKPLLAESWTISDDKLTYSFKLHEGVKFHNGTPFDCSVVKFSYERAVASDSTNAQKGLFEPIAKTECPDPLTAVVTLKRPASNFLFNMGWGDAVMIAPDSAAENRTKPVGTGPFKFKRWVQGDRVELERNPDYWGEPAKLSAITFRFVSDPSAAAAAILAGDIDVFPMFQAPELINRFKSDDKLQVEVGNTAGKVLLALNNARKPFDNMKVRRALAHAIDRKALIEGVYSGYGVPIGSHYAPVDPGYVELSETYPYDPTKAKQLLEEAGVAAGTQITIILPPPAYARRGGEIIAAMLAEVGIQAKLEPIEFAQWLDQVFKRSDFDATIIAHTEARDLDIYARDKYYFNYDSPEYKALFKAYAEAGSDDEQLELVVKLQQKLAEDEPNVFLYALPKIGVWNKGVKGLWKNMPIPADDLTQVYWEH
ncbi:ABC transporter substrate-binding protein [Falsochrobactrum sp. TDYN1]|uniref:ABC transporter substrate-binding protein n=1 Tax=Falsochrobactrum tianjinense TaxID=2706015 RepID=A0A949PL62_9HYPH|nr:ABC transporter substrate-binding protein [Falsochrobactrum sp. TDYN1]MBV2143257.1 ABC transporter substrate-binding protein [Falsochrobactrum sp. TDYN1]